MRKGFTLIELLIAIVVFAFLFIIIMRFYIVEHKTWLYMNQVAEMQQSGRVSMEDIARTIRMAGYMVPASLELIRSYDTNPDSIKIRSNFKDISTRLKFDLAIGGNLVVVDTTGFQIGGFVCLQSSEIGECGRITNITPFVLGGYLISTSSAITGSFDKNKTVVCPVDEVTYFLNSDTTGSYLMKRINRETAQIFAENIERLQFRYLCEDTIVDTLDFVDTLFNDRTVRVVYVDITARSERPDPDITTGNGYRRRQYNTGIKIRNYRY